MTAITACRTATLGGHVDECDSCGHLEISYNSCRNRHCPKCQFLKKEKWIEARVDDLLPIPYFHVTFTIPSQLNPLVLRNQKVMYDLLFLAVSETLVELANDPKHLGAHIGFIEILHTWGQNLMEHPHIHCVVTGGGLSPDGSRWISAGKKFFIPVKVMSALFKAKVLDYLKASYKAGDLVLPAGIGNLKDPGAFEVLRKQLYHKKWVVDCRAPFNGVQGVLQYLSRYTHRVAISNHRILNVDHGKVSFLWRDYADGSKEKVMTVEVPEFIRRFLLHVLPDRFVKIRHYGLLANRKRKDNITLCRKLLDSGTTVTKDKIIPETWQEHLIKVSGVDLTKCPCCQKGRMFLLEVLQPFRCNGPPGKYR
jgi:hypothetical protein